jgi:peptidoglycan hydrolase CwlO-like protein
MATLTKEIIEAAITGFEAQKRHLDEQLAELRAMLSSTPASSSSTSQPRGRRKRGMSEAGRKAIAEAQRKRWAAVRGESGPQKSAPKSKRKLSAAGRAAIVAALKKRWAAKKAASAGETQAGKKTATKKKAA